MIYTKEIQIQIDTHLYDTTIDLEVYEDNQPYKPKVVICDKNVDSFLIHYLKGMETNKETFKIYYQHVHVADMVGAFPNLIDVAFKHIVIGADLLKRL